MRPLLAAPLAALAALPAFFPLGTFLGGIAHGLVALLAGLVGLGWLAGPVQALVLLAVPPAVAAGAYVFIAHGPEAPWFGGLGGVLAGALLLAAGALTAALPVSMLLVLPPLLGAAGAALGQALGPRAAPSAAQG